MLERLRVGAEWAESSRSSCDVTGRFTGCLNHPPRVMTPLSQERILTSRTGCLGDPVESSVGPGKLKRAVMAARDYTFLIRGEFGRRYRLAFEDLHISTSGGHSELSGRLPDQAALYGVLRRLDSFGLEIIDIHSGVPVPNTSNHHLPGPG